MSGCSPAHREAVVAGERNHRPLWRFQRHQRCRLEPQTSWLQARLKDVAKVLDGPERHRQSRVTIVLCVQIKGGFVVS